MMIKKYTTLAATAALSIGAANAAVISNFDFDTAYTGANDQGNGTSQTASLSDTGWGTNTGTGGPLAGTGWVFNSVDFLHETSSTVTVGLTISDGVNTIASTNTVNQTGLSTGNLLSFTFTDTTQFDSASVLTFSFTGGTARFALDSPGSAGVLNTGQVNFSGTRDAALRLDVTQVPEPSSSALLGLGGLALILRRRK